MVALKLDLTEPAPEPELLTSTLRAHSQNCTLLTLPEDMVLVTVSVRFYLKVEDKIVTIPLPASLYQYMFKVLFQITQKSKKSSTSFSSIFVFFIPLWVKLREERKG